MRGLFAFVSESFVNEFSRNPAAFPEYLPYCKTEPSLSSDGKVEERKGRGEER